VDRRGEAGRQDDPPVLSSFSIEPSAAGAEPAGPQPGKFVAASGFAERDCELVSDQLAATAGEDRRTSGQTCALLLATAGGRTSDAAAVRGDAGPDRAATATDGIASWWPSQRRGICLQRVGGRRGVAKVGGKWRNFGCAGSESRTVDGDPDEIYFT